MPVPIPGGGAGIQADLKSFHANGVYGLSVVTAVTAQNTKEVRQTFELPADLIESQIDAVFDDFDVSAVKTGMLSSERVVNVVADRLAGFRAPNVVVDPVMVSSSGARLLEPEAVRGLKERLLPLAALVTPNLREAGILAGMPVETLDHMKTAARVIFDAGPGAVLVKGGHLGDLHSAVDVLLRRIPRKLFFRRNGFPPGTRTARVVPYRPRSRRTSRKGATSLSAVENAKTYVTEAIRRGLDIGGGRGPTHHFYFLDDRQ